MYYKIENICDITSSKRIFANEYTNNGVPFYRGKEIIELSQAKIVSTPLFISNKRFDEIKNHYGIPKKNDILMTAVGTLGIPYLVKEHNFYFKDGNLMWFKNFKYICSSNYFYYYLQSEFLHNILLSKSIGSTQKAITIDTVKNIYLQIHDKEMQQHIVNTIGSIDDLIEKYTNINNKLSIISELIINKALNNCYKIIKLKDIAIVKTGKATKKLQEGLYKIIGANGCLGYTNEFNQSGKAIITGRVGTIGTFAQINEDVWCSDNTLIINSRYFNYLYYFLKINFDSNSLNRGSTQPLITQTDLLNYEIKIPNNLEIIENKLVNLYSVIEKNKFKINYLINIKQKYLNKFFK